MYSPPRYGSAVTIGKRPLFPYCYVVFVSCATGRVSGPVAYLAVRTPDTYCNSCFTTSGLRVVTFIVEEFALQQSLDERGGAVAPNQRQSAQSQRTNDSRPPGD